ncbi:flavin-containing monooxygenase [Catellatospora coxensis]|nr:NAD(P)/FAD-dependent oxidoreductase [Catellatospora coxensis]
MTLFDAVVIGGGQSGLAAAGALQAHGRHPLVLEAGGAPTGSWARYYDSLTLFSPARHSALPGMPFPGDPDRYPHRDEVVAYLAAYAEHLGVPIRTRSRVTSVQQASDGFTVHTDADTLHTPIIVAATGGFGRPHRPDLPGLATYTGTVLHAADYRSPTPFSGQHVIVVGAGNSAVQIATELATVATVTLATRQPVRWFPQRPLGRDLHWWLKTTGLDTSPLGRLLAGGHRGAPVLDDGRYRAAVAAGAPRHRLMFTGLHGNTATWTDGSREDVHAIVLATGYRPDLGYLHELGALDADGRPRHRGGVSITHPGLGYVGLELQRSFASATLRGVGADAARVVARLTARRTSQVEPAR